MSYRVLAAMQTNRHQRAWLLLTVLTAALLPSSAQGKEAVRLWSPDMDGCRVVDTAGVEHRLGDDPAVRGYALVLLSPECPIACKYVPELNRLAEQARGLRLTFVGILADRTKSRATAQAFVTEYDLGFPVVFDASLALVQRLCPTHTPEAFVFDRDGALVYRGRIDNRFAAVGKERPQPDEHNLGEALNAVAEGRAAVVTYAEPVGCRYEGLAATPEATGPTFCREIAPIVWHRCAACHREGQVAPFALSSYADVRKHAAQIAEVVASGYMPPWKAAPGFNQFVDSRRLDDSERALIRAWVASGAPEGDAADLPPLPAFPDEWQLGEPDLVLEFPETVEVPADGPNMLRYFALPIPREFTGREVAACEFRPGNRRVVHHAITFLDLSGQGRRLDQADPLPGYDGQAGPGFVPIGYLNAWVPGSVVRRLPEGMGMLMPRGSMPVVMMHYAPTGKAETDRSSLGIYFTDRPAQRPVTAIPVLTTSINLPAGDAQAPVKIAYTLPLDVTALGVTPHMHYLGREMKVVARLPGASEPTPLVWIKDWDFNWQGQYDFREPLRLPKGTVIDVEAVYDNSAGNPFNPHSPPRTVTFGQGTNDEMCLCGIHVALDRPGDFAALAASLMRQFIQVQNGRLVITPLQ
ncbi:MAG: redoxin domain-containing protein [Pirellulales bacterium]|nr:redoxin domain-containing protein [Pirellulales bacterium]